MLVVGRWYIVVVVHIVCTHVSSSSSSGYHLSSPVYCTNVPIMVLHCVSAIVSGFKDRISALVERAEL